MKHVFPVSIVTRAFILTTLSIVFVSCTVKPKNEKPIFATDSMAAYFDYFTYEGNDDFYRENPLPDKDYFYNPIIPGWYSDPSVATNGKDFFLVTSTFSFFPGVPIFHSTDLINWEQIGHVLTRSEQLPLEGQRTSEGIFAPDISYNKHNQTWYVITTNIKKGNFFVKTKDPFGSWSDPIWLPDVHGIDPSFYFDDDGKAYIVYNDAPDGGSTYEGHRAIRVIRFDTETEKTIGPGKMIINGGVHPEEKPIWIEGPHLYKINGQYFLMCAEGGTEINHREVIFKGNAPMGEFNPWVNNPILTQLHLDPNRSTPVTCTGHADLVQKENGEWWAVFLACRPNNHKFENLGRETFLLPVYWSEDGFPYLTRGNEIVPQIVRMKGVKRKAQTTFGNFIKHDNFDTENLGMEWLSLRGPAPHLYSLTEAPGYLSLHCANAASNELKTPALLTRRLQHHRFNCTTSMYFNPKSETESAGMLLYKDEHHQYVMTVSKTENGKQIQLLKVKADGADVLASKPLLPSQNPLKLKISSNGKEFSFFYTSTETWYLLATNIDAYYLSTAQSYGFTGTTIGVYASNKNYIQP